MSIIVSDLSYSFPNHSLFSHLNFSVGNHEKVSIVGNNGVGKSTLLRLIAGTLQPAEGSVAASSKPYYIPQHTGVPGMSVAEALRVDKKLTALRAIEQGNVEQANFDILAEDWNVEERCAAALAHWSLQHVQLDAPADNFSGGEITKIFLAGLIIHSPEIILLDEPTNHLDQTSRELLYDYIAQSNSCIMVVSHDVSLLNLLETTYELSENGVKLYGGDYDFYREQKQLELHALSENIRDEEKHLRLSRKKAQEVKQRQERRASQGEKSKASAGMARIVANAMGASAENTAAKLKDKHSKIIDESREKLSKLRQQQERARDLKMDFDNAQLHAGKLLIEASDINYSYIINNYNKNNYGESFKQILEVKNNDEKGALLWKSPLNFKLYSSDRIRILGDNGAGKTTFINLLTGELNPTCGDVRRADFEWIYLDQNYTQVDVDDTIIELAEKYNVQNLQEHEIKIRLNRFLFPADTWDKPCEKLSGGEKMRLYLCCLMIKNQTPDLIILDEPTNNLDVSSLQILIQTIKNYKGSLLVISHDRYFVEEVGITGDLVLSR